MKCLFPSSPLLSSHVGFIRELHEIRNILRNEEYGLTGCNAVYFEGSPMFRRNISPPSSGYKNKASNKSAEKRRQAETVAKFTLAKAVRALCNYSS
jgi:hypothetical protein